MTGSEKAKIDQVYQLNIQFFQLTEGLPINDKKSIDKDEGVVTEYENANETVNEGVFYHA